MIQNKGTVFVTGGAGYVGAALVPQLLDKGYRVRVIDLFLFRPDVFDHLKGNPDLECIRGDIRDQELLKRSVPGCDTVLHLACVSNDPSFELDPELSKSINFDAFGPLVRISKQSGSRRFIYISTSSVYGVSDAPEVTEDHPLVPLTDYNKYKGLCEPVLLEEQSPDFTAVIIRPATVCGYSRRLRLDLSVNILTNHAVNNGKITVFGGSQKRPNVHIQDVCDLYADLIDMPSEKVAGKTWNVGTENVTILDLAKRIRDVVRKEYPDRGEIGLEVTPSNDLRSYHISSEKIKRDIGFVPRRTVEDAVKDLCRAFREGRIPDPMNDIRYYNVRMAKAANVK